MEETIKLFDNIAKAVSVIFPVMADLIGVLLFGALIWFVVVSRAKMAAPTASVVGCLLLGGVFSLALGNLGKGDNVQVSITKLELTIKRAETVIDAAAAKVTELHQLAVAMGKFQVDLLASEGRFPGPDFLTHKEALKTQLLDRLKAMGLSKEELDAVDEADRAFVVTDYAIEVLKPIARRGDAARQAAYAKALNTDPPPSPDECEKLLRQFGVYDAKAQEWVEDYRYYLAHGQHRRPDVWLSRLYPKDEPR